MLSATEGLGLLGWVRFGVLVVWWLLLPCPPWFEEISSELGYFGVFLGFGQGEGVPSSSSVAAEGS